MSDNLTEKESFWHASVGLWEESGLNARQFCKQEGLAYQSFLSWEKRFQETSDSFIELEEIAPLFFDLRYEEITLSFGSSLSSVNLSHLGFAPGFKKMLNLISSRIYSSLKMLARVRQAKLRSSCFY